MDYLKQFSKKNLTFKGNYPILLNKPICEIDKKINDGVVFPSEPFILGPTNPNVDDCSCPDGYCFPSYENSGNYYSTVLWNTRANQGFCYPPPHIIQYQNFTGTNNKGYLKRHIRMYRDNAPDVPGMRLEFGRTETLNPTTNSMTISNVFGSFRYDFISSSYPYNIRCTWDLTFLPDGSGWIGSYEQSGGDSDYYNFGVYDLYWPAGTTYCGGTIDNATIYQFPVLVYGYSTILYWYGYGYFSNQSLPIYVPGKGMYGGFNADVFVSNNYLSITLDTESEYSCI